MNDRMCRVEAQIRLLGDSRGSTLILGGVRCDWYGKKRLSGLHPRCLQ
jgi:hypothetical protein